MSHFETQFKSNLDSYNNSWFKKGSNFFKLLIWFYINSIFFQSSLVHSFKIKIILLRLFGSITGKGIILKPSVNVKYPWRLVMGNNIWIGEKVWIDNLVKVKIGSNVCISQGAMLLTGNHNYKKSTFDLITGEITLEDGVWIGAKAVVCPGVTCKSHSILTVGSVATSDLEPYTIYQGNPAKPIRKREISE